ISDKIIDCQFNEFIILQGNSIAVSKDDEWMAFNNLGEDVSTKSKSFLNFIKDIKNKKRKKSRIIKIVTVLSFILLVIIMDAVSGNIGIIKEFKILTQGEEKFIWNEYRETQDIQILYSYLKKYPNGKYKSEAESIIEEMNWRVANNNNTINSFKNYLKAYPNGEFKLLAKENIDWIKAKQRNTLYAYKDYLKKHIQGNHVMDAKNYIDNLIWDEALRYNNSYYYQYYLSNAPIGIHRTDAMIELKSFDTIDEAVNYLQTEPNGIYKGKAIDKLAESSHTYYIIDAVFYNFKNSEVSKEFHSSDVSSIAPQIKLISTKDVTIDLSYKFKDDRGWFAGNGITDSEKFNLVRGINTIQFSNGFRYAVHEWFSGIYTYYFYADGIEIGSEPLILN
ncbi:MAG: hypothetical protein M1391_03020, partial [Bacteroidetes bacterium]|nr:hypothetical protein [Bacteroidota bacterium]